MSQTTIPLNEKQRARLTETEKRVNEIKPFWDAAVSTHGAVIGSVLDHADIDAASVTDVKVTADGLVVTVKSAGEIGVE